MTRPLEFAQPVKAARFNFDHDRFAISHIHGLRGDRQPACAIRECLSPFQAKAAGRCGPRQNERIASAQNLNVRAGIKGAQFRDPGVRRSASAA